MLRARPLEIGLGVYYRVVPNKAFEFDLEVVTVITITMECWISRERRTVDQAHYCKRRVQTGGSAILACAFQVWHM